MKHRQQTQLSFLLIALLALSHSLKSETNYPDPPSEITCPELLIIPVNTVCGLSEGAVELTVTPPESYTYNWSNGATTQNINNVPEGTYTVTVTDANGCSATASATVFAWTSGFSLSGTTTNPTAGQTNGAINLSVDPPGAYNYSWSNGATTQDLSNLSSGPYSVTVTNPFGCTETASFILEQVCDLSVTYTVSPALPFCPGELVTFTLVPAGGTMPYSYSWTNGSTNQSITFVAGGVITMDGSVMDANDCISTVYIHLKSTIWQTFVVPYPATCGQNDGIVDLTVVGGDTYEYDWSNGATTEDLIDVAAGTYTVTVTSSAGCTVTGSATVTNSTSSLGLSGILTPNTSCLSPNGAVDVLVDPPGAYTYNWSNGATTEGLVDVGAGTYSVTVSGGGGCSSTASFVVSSNIQLPIPSAVASAATCGQADGSIDLSVNPSGSYTYNWSNGDATEDLFNLMPGTYSVTVTSADGCTATTSGTVGNNTSGLTLSGGATPNTSCLTPNGAVDISVNPPGIYTYSWLGGATTEDLTDLAAGTYSVTVSGGGGCTSAGSFVVSSNLVLPIPVAVASPATCSQADGAINLNVNPSGSYTYDWSSGEVTQDLANLFPGTYSVTVTSSEGCTATTSAVVNDNAAPLDVSAALSPNISCLVPNGVVDISIDPPGVYTYDWSNGETTEDLANLAAGTYSVTVTGAGTCTGAASFVIANNVQLPVPSAIASPANCGQGDGLINLSVSPSGSYTYDWSNGETSQDLNGLFAGTYSVTVTNAGGCTATLSSVVSNSGTNFSLSAAVLGNTSCVLPNGSIDLNTSTPGTYTYNWSNGASTQDLANLASGGYQVTVTDANGCTATGAETVANNAANFSLSAAVLGNTSCVLPNGSIDLNTSIPGTYTYNWSNGASTQDLSNLASGGYQVTVTDANGCTATGAETVANNAANFSLSAAVLGNTSCATPNGSIDLNTSIPGTYTYNWSNGASTQDLANLASGGYQVTVTDANGCTATGAETVANNAANFSLSAAVLGNTSCTAPNGSIDLNTSIPGTYTYNWSNGASTQDLANLAPGGYQVTVTDANGCTATGAETVANNATNFSLSATVLGNTSCTAPNGSIDLNTSIPGTYTYNWSNGASTQDLANLASGGYQVTVTDANGCTATATETVANNATNFSLSAAVLGNTSCTTPNGSIDLNTSIPGTYTYNWSNGASTQDLANLASGGYQVTVTDANGCTATDAETVANNAMNFSLSAAVLGNTSCSTPNGSIDLNTSIPGTYTYNWSNGASTQDLANLASGGYQVTVTDANGCTATGAETVANNATNFSLSAAVLGNTSCTTPNGSIDLNTSIPGTYTYNWSNGSSTQDLANLASGGYQVTVTDANGCTATDAETVANNAANFSLSAAVLGNTSCTTPNGSIDLNTSISGTYTYNWSNGASTQDLANLASGGYQVTVTDANGCTATSAETVANNATNFSLSAAVLGNTSCVLPNGSIDLNTSIPGTYTYNWSNGASTQDLANLASGGYQVTVTDANGCTATGAETVANNATNFSLSATVLGNTSCVLPNGSIDLNTSIPGTYTYNWSNGASTQDLANLASGGYQVTVTDANGCTATGAETILANIQLVQINLATSPATCSQPNGEISLEIIAGLEPFVFNWSNGASTQILSNIAPGPYSVTVSSANGCTQTAAATISTQGSDLSISANIAQNNSCLDPVGAIDLSVSSTGSLSYLWSNLSTTQDLQSLAAGTYGVTVTDDAGCSTTGTYTITEQINPPEIQVEVTPVDCQNPMGAIQIELVTGAEPLQYSIDAGAHFSTLQSFENLPAGSYQLLVIDAQHCETTMPVLIPEPVLPVLSPLPDIDLEFGALQTLDVQLPVGFPIQLVDTVLWWSTSGLSFSGNTIQDLLHPSIQGLESQLISVQIWTTQGCMVEASFQLNVNTTKGLYAPNVIWPEDPDGNNAAFTLFTKPGSVREILILKVYDRWGNELFSREHFPADRLELGWNGDFRDKPMNPAVFVWWAEVEWVDGQRTIHKGDVTVVR